MLYRTDERWRFAVYSDTGVIDGVLPDASADVEQAQADLLARVERTTERRYTATWTQDKPDWWSADLGPGHR